jgi:hypothetical protein
MANETEDYGEKLTTVHENASQWKNRGRPNKSTSSEDGENWNTGYDVNMRCTQYPDGSWIRQCYGKNPSYSYRHSSGKHGETLQDGATYSFNTGPKMGVNKSDVSQTDNGSKDYVAHNARRDNAGTEKGGGYYQDAGKGGYAMGAGTGGKALYTDGDMQITSGGSTKITGSKELTIGSGNENSQYSQYITMREDGGMVIRTGTREKGAGGTGTGSGGGGDIVIRSDRGSIKFVAGNGSKQASITIGSDGHITINADGGDLSLSSTDMRFAPKKAYAWAIKPAVPQTGIPARVTNYGAEHGFHMGEYNAYHGGKAREIS